MTKMVRIDDDVRAVLVRATMNATTVVLPELCERGLYTRVDKVLRAAGGKWNRKARAHVFDSVDPRTLLGDVATAPSIVNRRQDLQQFPTPAPIAAALVELAGVLPSHRCLEPSAGRGAIAGAMQAVGVEQPTLLEIDRECVAELLRVGFKQVYLGDFLKVTPKEWETRGLAFDRIVMNPPFRNGQDIAHVTRAYDLLAEGGVLVSIMAPSIDFRSTKAHVAFRELLDRHGRIVERLPRGTFEDTDIETIVVRMEK